MDFVLAELLSTIGMVLLVGEHLQGRSRWFNRSVERLALRFCNQGMMGYKTPNIDRIAKVRAVFTDTCGQRIVPTGSGPYFSA